ncbi:MAG: hypothetical protein MI923_20230 [Phycisphaerales bacterium]|nr:hypothetical protein [Phycisphaerales bacterium]
MSRNPVILDQKVRGSLIAARFGYATRSQRPARMLRGAVDGRKTHKRHRK